MKSLGKTKRKLVWCCEEPRPMHGVHPDLGIMNKPKPRIGRLRCPDCGKKFNPRIHDCGDGNCWHATIPPHKKYIKETRK